MRVWAVGMAVTAVVAGSPAAAAAAEKPVLVVVEGALGGDDDPAEIRRAIAAELHQPAVAPVAAESEAAERALIVGVERHRVAVALRAPDAAPVLRVIPAPADHAARVRAITWLAGNLARDQVSGIVTDTPPTASGLAEMPALAPTTPGNTAIEPAAPHPKTEPPPYEPPAGTVFAGAAPAALERPRWVLSLEAGPVVGIGGTALNFSPLSLATLWRVELRHFSADHLFFIGVSAEGTAGSNFGLSAYTIPYQPETFGAAGLCGWVRRRERWAAEATLGMGVDIGPSASALGSTSTRARSTMIIDQWLDRRRLRDRRRRHFTRFRRRRGPVRARGRAHLHRGPVRLVSLVDAGCELRPAVKTQARFESAISVPVAPLTESELLTGLRSGDLRILAAAFDRWHHRVRVLARRLLSDDAAAEDVVQDVFTALPGAVRSFREDAGLETFVLGIAVKRVRRHRRAAFRRQRALERLGLEDLRQPDDLEGDVYRHQLGRRLACALDRLPLPQRVAFVLCEVEEMTAGQAAHVAACPEATVRTRLFHARRRLREILAEEDAR